MSNAQRDYYGVLNVSPQASFAEIRAAYERLSRLYSAERLQDSPPEFQELAASKRAEFEDAYRVLSDPERRAAYDQSRVEPAVAQADVLDYRPLPRAFGKERAAAMEETEQRTQTTAAARTAQGYGWLPLVLGMLIVLALMVQLVLSNVRVVEGATALATPTIPNLPLPFTTAQLEQMQSAAEEADTFETWRALGNALFNNQQTMRENVPQSPQYRAALENWLETVAAYDRALALQEDEVVRSDRALSLFSYGVDAGERERVREAVLEAEQALQRDIDAPRALINYGLILAWSDPPRVDAAIGLWKQVEQIAPESIEAERARALLERFRQE